MADTLQQDLTRLLLKSGSQETVSRLYDFAVANGLPVAVWKLPNNSRLHVLIQTSPEKTWLPAGEATTTAGFVIAPFTPEPAGLLVLRPDLVISLNGQTAQVSISTAAGLDQLKGLAFSARKPSPPASGSPPETGCRETDKAAYTSSVAKAVEEIKQGNMEKVVLSRSKATRLQPGFSAVGFWGRLCQAYPGAFASLVWVPGLGTWAGASPEVLLEVTGNRIFRTMSLAGTQPVQPGVPECDVSWSQKEIEEQALVSRYIINCFKQIRLREYEEKGPRTITAGHVWHLQSIFTVDMQATERPDLPGKMLELLHPTSAVGGMPKDKALAFIGQHEQHDRQLYSGFLGPVLIDGYTGLFVNLRCMQIQDGSAVLYAGAGITQDSDPEREWQETELKTLVLSRMINEPLPA